MIDMNLGLRGLKTLKLSMFFGDGSICVNACQLLSVN